MSQSRYKESRTLVRRLCRMPGENREAFKIRVLRLRGHFERFNVDTSELCQWLMGLRRRYGKSNEPASLGELGDFLLEPAIEDMQADEKLRDQWRAAVFDVVAGFLPRDSLTGLQIPSALWTAMERAADDSPTPTASRLFTRLALLHPAHRLVLLKSAAEWVVARYQRGMENWVRQRAEWEREKAEWEAKHPELTEAIRDRFKKVFLRLNDPDNDEKPGLRRKNPRICPHARLKENIDNCCYAGEKGHGPLCWKYKAFVAAQEKVNTRFNKKRFWEDAQRLVAWCACKDVKQPSNAFLSPSLPGILFKDAPQHQRAQLLNQLKAAWSAYLNYMGLKADTVVSHGKLPHCRTIGETFEKSKCVWNPHTGLCQKYKRSLNAEFGAASDAEALKHEGTYREWRRLYLAGPRKPSFRYPSSRDLPMPKVFGAGFHEIDFDRSILRLRLDDMAEGEWIEFGFTPWPRVYDPSRERIKNLVTSVHVNFVGVRARVGFRFSVEHRPSRFGCSQDELDELRSRRFPRQAQDRQFLEAARKRLIESYTGADRPMRVMAVDLGLTGAHAAVYEGKSRQKDVPLEIVKINKAYTEVPERLEKHPKDTKMRGAIEIGKDDPRGLRKEHIVRHIEAIEQNAANIAEHRRERESDVVTPEEHDFRTIKRHVRWMIRDWARHNARRIIDAAEAHNCDVIVFESLRGSRLPGYEVMDADKKRRQAMFAFGRVRRKVVEKAVERGMRVVTAPYFKSSQVCSACGAVQENRGLWTKNKAARKFICEREHCKATVNSDANAARLLGRVFWDEITLPEPT